MINFIYGIAGAVAVLAIFFCGWWAGQKLGAAVTAGQTSANTVDATVMPAARTEPPPGSPEAEERKRLLEEQKAFDVMMGYDRDMVYQVKSPVERMMGK